MTLSSIDLLVPCASSFLYHPFSTAKPRRRSTPAFSTSSHVAEVDKTSCVLKAPPALSATHGLLPHEYDDRWRLDRHREQKQHLLIFDTSNEEVKYNARTLCCFCSRCQSSRHLSSSSFRSSPWVAERAGASLPAEAHRRRETSAKSARAHPPALVQIRSNHIDLKATPRTRQS